MNTEEQRLTQLRARMSTSQRQQMAEIIQNEMKRRGMSTSDTAEPTPPKSSRSSMSRNEVGELYRDISDAVKKIRINKTEQKISALKPKAGFELPFRRGTSRSEARASAPELRAPRRSSGKMPRVLAFTGIVALGFLKIMFESGAVDASSIASSGAIAQEFLTPKKEMSQEIVAPAPLKIDTGVNPSDLKILQELDQRRVQLEARKDALDRRELDIKNQSQALNERIAELRSLTAKLTEAHREKDTRYEGRMGQLANVYGAMSPQEAAGLLGRLENETAIELLQRMPEKRMGQILSFMEKERAVELTRILSDKTSLQ